MTLSAPPKPIAASPPTDSDGEHAGIITVNIRREERRAGVSRMVLWILFEVAGEPPVGALGEGSDASHGGRKPSHRDE